MSRSFIDARPAAAAAAGTIAAPKTPRAPRERPPLSKTWPVHLALLLISAGFLLPFAWMLSTSFKSLGEAVQFPPNFIPHEPRPENYVKVLTQERVDFPLMARNTLIIATLAVTGTTLS